jgi:hypothetical protein
VSSNASKASAAAALRAEKENRLFDQKNLNQGQARYLAQMLGPDEAEKYLRATLGQDQYRQLFRDPDATKRTTALNEQLKQIQANLDKYGKPERVVKGGKDPSKAAGYYPSDKLRLVPADWDKKRAAADGVDIGALLKQQKELTAQLQNEAASIPADALDLGEFRNLGPGAASRYAALTEQAKAEGAANLNRFDADSGRLMQSARAIEGQARNFGKGERDRINADFANTLQSTNRLTEARLMSRGLGASSVLGQQLGGNARQLEQGRQGALGSLGDRQIGLMTSLAGNTLNLDQARSSGRMGLNLASQDRVAMNQRGEADFRAQVASSAQMNPWLARSTQQYFSGASPSAAAGATWGNALGAFGGNMMGQSANFSRPAATTTNNPPAYDPNQRPAGGWPTSPSGYGDR